MVKRLLFGALMIVAFAANAQQAAIGTWALDGSDSGTSTPATCTTAGMVPVFLGSPIALGCDAGLTYDAATGTLTVGAAGVIRNGSDTWAAGYTAGSNDYGLHISKDWSLTWAAGPGASGAVDLGLARASAGVLKVTDGGAGAGGIQAAGVTVLTGSRPTADAASRGMIWYVAGGAGVADTLEVCVKSGADTYSWVSLF